MRMQSQSPRILVVDDDPSIREVIVAALAQRGYDVLSASDGTQGIVYFERDTPDLLVLDVIMPRRSGFQILDRILSSSQTRPKVIVITGTDARRVREIMDRGDIDAFFAKPFDVADLVASVESLVPLTT
ncbi:MAG: response regulator [Planctomycetaceae bacterium]